MKQPPAIFDWRTWEVLQAMFAEKGIYIETDEYEHGHSTEYSYMAMPVIDDREGTPYTKLRPTSDDARIYALQEATKFLSVSQSGVVYRNDF